MNPLEFNPRKKKWFFFFASFSRDVERGLATTFSSAPARPSPRRRRRPAAPAAAASGGGGGGQRRRRRRPAAAAAAAAADRSSRRVVAHQGSSFISILLWLSFLMATRTSLISQSPIGCDCGMHRRVIVIIKNVFNRTGFYRVLPGFTGFYRV